MPIFSTKRASCWCLLPSACYTLFFSHHLVLLVIVNKISDTRYVLHQHDAMATAITFTWIFWYRTKQIIGVKVCISSRRLSVCRRFVPLTCASYLCLSTCFPQVFSRSTKGYVYALSGTPELWSHVVPNRTQIVQVRLITQDGIVPRSSCHGRLLFPQDQTTWFSL